MTGPSHEQAEDQPLGYLLYRIMAALRPAATAELKPLGLTLPEFVCLRILSMQPGRSSAELARDTNVSPQAMNAVLRGLQDSGVVKRPASVSSGRALPAHLTSDGKALLKRAEAAVRTADDRVLAGLSAEQRRVFRQLVDAIGSKAEPLAGGITPPCFDELSARNALPR
ncbi:MarR family winged helix-turn-helix transcriptional regulator [Mycolicibacterium komossense]|uniref:MarR family transcriptional regulator n=1 Tax=Mycolicibacterium komossense TaxID=1779 RepID=A0ABT3CE45_9MYCO|nr:MarR family transcriptional regulator [Mycolicibacterium komossense]MCV7227754.1 MarR family transcriptional regulator [Mycolicibacterium komossense]